MTTALDLITAAPWAITEPALAQIVTIAQRLHGETPEAVATRLGRPLENTRRATERGDTAVIPITGPIFRRANLFTEISGATSTELLARDLQAAADNPDIRRLVLEIDSPGGQANGISELATQIRTIAATKPITAYVDGTAASAAYWLASAASEIVLSDTAVVGSIGVVATYKPEKDAPLKIISSQSPLKQATPDTPEGREELQRLIDQMAEVFITTVAINRGTDPDTVLANFGRGGLLLGAHAITAGMADRIATFESLFTTTTLRGNTMTYQADLNAALGLPADASAEEAIVTISTQQTDAIAKAKTEAHTAGAAAERERIAAVRAQAIPGHDALIEQLAFDGKTTGPEAAMAILAAERQLRAAHQTAIDAAPPAVDAALAPDPDATSKAASVTKIRDAYAKINAQITTAIKRPE